MEESGSGDDGESCWFKKPGKPPQKGASLEEATLALQRAFLVNCALMRHALNFSAMNLAEKMTKVTADLLRQQGTLGASQENPMEQAQRRKPCEIGPKNEVYCPQESDSKSVGVENSGNSPIETMQPENNSEMVEEVPRTLVNLEEPENFPGNMGEMNHFLASPESQGQSITQISTAVCSPGQLSPRHAGGFPNFQRIQELGESRILRAILDHNSTIVGPEKRQNAKKFVKLTQKIEELLRTLNIPEETGIRSKILSLLEPLVPTLSDIFKSKSFDVVLVALIVFVCKWKGYPRTSREIIVKLMAKEKMVNRCLLKLREIFPRESIAQADPKSFIYRIVADLCLAFEKDQCELIRLSEQFLANLSQIRLMTNEHALTVACFCVYLACLVKNNPYKEMRKLAEVANISKGTLLHIYRKYFPFRQWLFAGIEGASGELLRDL